MDAVWSIIFAFVCCAIGLILERKKESRSNGDTTAEVPSLHKLRTACHPKAQKHLQAQKPLPAEGQHIDIPMSTPEEIAARQRRDRNAQELRKHYARWQQAVVARTVLDKNQFI